jgi:hypothetical protein
MYFQLCTGNCFIVGLYVELHSNIQLNYLVAFNEPDHVAVL